MADIDPTESGLTVKICDGTANEMVSVLTTDPSASEPGLIVRETARGSQDSANSIPVVIANDQEPIDVALVGDRDDIVNQETLISTTTAETTILTAGAGGVFHDIMTITITGNRDVGITFRDATAGTIKLVINLDQNAPFVHLPFSGALVQTTAANNWTAQLDASNAVVAITVTAIGRTS
ncbi:MAG: hypothetical protein ACW99G_01155 [Candidatus Thorarchaeota archaeon]|jgi:hypothetical protein